jgi:hypothetical protein
MASNQLGSPASKQNQTSPPAACWSKLSKEQISTVAEETRVLCERFVPAMLGSMVSGIISQPLAARFYLDRFIEDSGKAADPVERVLLEQLAIAHIRLAMLNAQASEARDLALVNAFNSAAARLLDSIRKLALAIKQYRQPPAAKTFITQQNVAHEQQVTYTHQVGPGAKETLQARDTKVGSNGGPTDAEPRSSGSAEFTAGDRWPAESLEAAGAQC